MSLISRMFSSLSSQEPIPDDQSATVFFKVALLSSLAITSALLIYLLYSYSVVEPYGSERLYWEYAGKVLGSAWTPGYSEFVHDRLVAFPPLPSEASSVTHLAPYTGFRLEYPPGAMIYMSMLRLVADDFNTFGNLHHVVMAIAFVVAIWSALQTLLQSSPSRLGFAAAAVTAPVLLYLVGGALTLFRFDALATAFAALGVLQAVRQRPILAAILIGIGTGIKLWPIFLIPFMLQPGNLRSQVVAFFKMTAIALATVLLLHVFWLPFGTAQKDLFGYLQFASERPLHTESLVLLLSTLLGQMTDAVAVVSYGSHNWVGGNPIATPLQLRVVFFLFAGIMALSALHMSTTSIDRSERLQVQACLRLAVIALLMCTSTFFSVEYMIWLVPLALAIAGPWQMYFLLSTIVAAVAGKLTYTFYTSVEKMDPTGQAFSSLKWAAISAMVLLAVPSIVAAFREQPRSSD
jgi:hypothetical protein